MKRLLRIILITLLFSVFFAPSAYAYMDPGTGSYIFQIVIAGVIGGLFVLKTSWGKIVKFFRKSRERSE